MADMELRHLRYFVAVADTLHFTRAAERLHLTQPALSRQIHDLEDELGVVLFRRHGHETALTPAGRRFLVHAQEMLELAERAVRDVRQEGSTLRFGHYGTLWVDRYGPALRAFGRQHPKVALRAVEQTPVELVKSLRRGEVDVALIGPSTPALRKEFEVKRLESLPALVALGSAHPLAKKRKLALNELRGTPWIVWDEKDFPGREMPLREAARKAGFEPKVLGRADSVASLFVQLADGAAAGYVLPMSRKLPHVGVAFAEVKPPGIELAMDVAWRREGRPDKTVLNLVDLLATVKPAP